MYTQFMTVLSVGKELKMRKEKKKFQLCQVYLEYFNNPVEANMSKYSYLNLFFRFFF